MAATQEGGDIFGQPRMSRADWQRLVEAVKEVSAAAGSGSAKNKGRSGDAGEEAPHGELELAEDEKLVVAPGRLYRICWGAVCVRMPEFQLEQTLDEGSFIGLETAVGAEVLAGIEFLGAAAGEVEAVLSGHHSQKDHLESPSSSSGGTTAATLEYVSARHLEKCSSSVLAPFFLEAARQFSNRLCALPVPDSHHAKKKAALAKKASKGSGLGTPKLSTKVSKDVVARFPNVKRTKGGKSSKCGRLDLYSDRLEHVHQVFGLRSKSVYPLAPSTFAKVDDATLRATNGDDKEHDFVLCSKGGTADTILSAIQDLKQGHAAQRKDDATASVSALLEDSSERKRHLKAVKEAWQAILGLAELTVTPAGGTIVKAGDAAGKIYQISVGVATVVSEPDAHGKRSVLTVMQPGDVFGEMSLLTNQPVSATVLAGNDDACEVYVIDGAQLSTAFAKGESANAEQRRFCKFLSHVVSRRIQQREKQLLAEAKTLRERREAQEAKDKKLQSAMEHDLRYSGRTNWSTKGSDEFGSFNAFSLG